MEPNIIPDGFKGLYCSFEDTRLETMLGKTLYSSEDTMDVTFQFEEGLVKAHSLVLQTRSPYFKAALRFPTSPPSNSSIATEKQPSASPYVLDFREEHQPQTVREIVRFFYLNEVRVPTDNALGLEDLISFAQKLEIPFVLKAINSVMKKVTNVRDAVSYYLLAKRYHLADCESRLIQVLASKANELATKLEFFTALPEDCVHALLSSSEVFANEIDLFKATCAWIHQLPDDDKSVDKNEKASKLLPLIKYEAMDFEDIQRFVKPEPLVSKDILFEIYEKLAAAKKPCAAPTAVPSSVIAAAASSQKKTAEEVPRHGFCIALRGEADSNARMYYRSSKQVERLRFTVSSAIELTGLAVFVSPGSYRIKADILVEDRGALQQFKNEVAAAQQQAENSNRHPPTSVLRRLAGATRILDVEQESQLRLMLPKPFRLIAGINYEIALRIQGPPTPAMTHASSRVISHGIEFKFSNSPYGPPDVTHTFRKPISSPSAGAAASSSSSSSWGADDSSTWPTSPEQPARDVVADSWGGWGVDSRPQSSAAQPQYQTITSWRTTASSGQIPVLFFGPATASSAPPKRVPSGKIGGQRSVLRGGFVPETASSQLDESGSGGGSSGWAASSQDAVNVWGGHDLAEDDDEDEEDDDV